MMYKNKELVHHVISGLYVTQNNTIVSLLDVGQDCFDRTGKVTLNMGSWEALQCERNPLKWHCGALKKRAKKREFCLIYGSISTLKNQVTAGNVR